VIKISISASAGWLAALLLLASGCAFEPADDCDAQDCSAEWEASVDWDAGRDDQSMGGPGYADGLDEEVVSFPGKRHLEAPPRTFDDDSVAGDDEENPDPQPWLLGSDNPDPQPWEDGEDDNPDPQPWEYELADDQNPDPQPWHKPTPASAYGSSSGHDQEPDPQPW
jgi:hypothetical protein